MLLRLRFVAVDVIGVHVIPVDVIDIAAVDIAVDVAVIHEVIGIGDIDIVVVVHTSVVPSGVPGVVTPAAAVVVVLLMAAPTIIPTPKERRPVATMSPVE